MANIAVFGASGSVGSKIVDQLLDREYSVNTVTRNRGNLDKEDPNLTIFEGDVTQPDTIEAPVRNSDVIISSLGVPIYRSPVCSTGILNILSLMNQDQKLIAISAYGANESNHGFYAKLTRLVIPFHMRDKDKMEDLIRDSNYTYTIIRPTRLKNGKYTGNYQTGELNIGLIPSVSTGDVADLALRSIDGLDNQTINISS